MTAFFGLAAASTVSAQVNVKVSDVSHFKGPRINRLQGISLVIEKLGITPVV